MIGERIDELLLLVVVVAVVFVVVVVLMVLELHPCIEEVSSLFHEKEIHLSGVEVG